MLWQKRSDDPAKGSRPRHDCQNPRPTHPQIASDQIGANQIGPACSALTPLLSGSWAVEGMILVRSRRLSGKKGARYQSADRRHGRFASLWMLSGGLAGGPKDIAATPARTPGRAYQKSTIRMDACSAQTLRTTNATANPWMDLARPAVFTKMLSAFV